MSFLKLGDLIDGGHPATVGDDGTVFTRLNMGNATVNETTTSSQDICLDDLPIDFLSDISFVSFANDVELTVINSEDCQNEGFLDDISSAIPNSKCNAEDSTTPFLDLDEYQIACASNELLESCLQCDATERESDNAVGQYLNEDLFIANLEASIECVPNDALFQNKITLNTADVKAEEIAPTAAYLPNYSRVLLDIGNLSCGTVLEHQGFIKLTTDDSIPSLQDSVGKDRSETAHQHPAASDTPKLTSKFDESLICPSAPLIKIEPEEKETNLSDSEIDVTSESDMIFEIDQAPEPNAIERSQKSSFTIKQEFFESDCNDISTTLHVELINPKASTNEDESNCDSETDATYELKTIDVKSSSTKHKCPDPVCDESFPSVSSAKRHCSLVHGPIKPFYCTIQGCGIAFRFASYLARHVRSKHNGIRDYECADCGHRFLTSRDLAVHERKHTGERSVPCPHAGCDLTFSARSVADTHFLVKHRMVKSHQCKECGKAFGTLSNLKEHSVTHSGAKDFMCSVSGCGKAFQTKGKLKRHGLSHSKVSPFQCKQCDRTFREGSSLNKHMVRKHHSSANN